MARQQSQAEVQQLELVSLGQNLRNQLATFTRHLKVIQIQLHDFVRYPKPVCKLLAGLIFSSRWTLFRIDGRSLRIKETEETDKILRKKSLFNCLISSNMERYK